MSRTDYITYYTMSVSADGANVNDTAEMRRHGNDCILAEP
jgi:hypothetical protein